MKKLWMALAVGVALATGGCDTVGSVFAGASAPVTQSQIATARDVAYGAEAAYGAALTAANAYGDLKSCGTVGALPPPGCKTIAGMRQIESVRSAWRLAIDRLNSVIADTTTTSSQLATAIRLVNEAAATYRQIAAANNVKG